MPTEETKSDIDKLLADFMEAVSPIFPAHRFGHKADTFGGQILFAYLVKWKIGQSHAATFCRELGVSEEQLDNLLPLAATKYLESVPSTIINALNELAAVCVTEIILNPAGIKSEMVIDVAVPGPINQDSTDPFYRARAKLTLKNGIVERHLINKGRLSQWSKSDLEPIIQGALMLLSKPRRTYENVLLILKGIYGDNAPATPGALRKALERAEIDWKKLKADILQ